LGRFILKRILGPLGAGWMVGEGLSYADPSGNLWGATSGIDDWVSKHWGFDPSKSGTDSQSFQNWLQRHATMDTSPAAMPDPFKGTNPYDDPLKKSFLPPSDLDDTRGSDVRERAGSPLPNSPGWTPPPIDIGQQSAVVQDQARQLMASIQAIFNGGVDVPIRLDASGVQAAARAAKASADATVDAHLRSTYADIELG
jgi:hypothetical protein